MDGINELLSKRAAYVGAIELIDQCIAAMRTADAAGMVDDTGPELPRAFRYRGETFQSMPPLAHRLLARLWGTRNRVAEASTLAEVWGDHAREPDQYQLARVRSAINTFMRNWGLPFRLCIDGGIVSVVEKSVVKSVAKPLVKPRVARSRKQKRERSGVKR